MAKIVSVTVVGVSASRPIHLNPNANPFAVGFGVNVVGSAAPTYSVQHTFHDLLSGTSAVWYDHSYVSGESGDIDGNYAFPVAAMRLNVTAAGSASPSVTLHVIQAGV